MSADVTTNESAAFSKIPRITPLHKWIFFYFLFIFFNHVPIRDHANCPSRFQCLMQNAGQQFGQGGASSHQGAAYGHTESSVSTKRTLEHRR